MAAMAQVQSLAKEFPHAVGTAKKSKKKNYVKTAVKRKTKTGSHCSSVVTDLISIHEDGGSIPGPRSVG